MSYYKTIDGKKMDGYLLSMADKAVQGAGDGRISKKDAEEIITVVKDGGTYTETEKPRWNTFVIPTNGQMELMNGFVRKLPDGQPQSSQFLVKPVMRIVSSVPVESAVTSRSTTGNKGLM